MLAAGQSPYFMSSKQELGQVVKAPKPRQCVEDAQEVHRSLIHMQSVHPWMDEDSWRFQMFHERSEGCKTTSPPNC